MKSRILRGRLVPLLLLILIPNIGYAVNATVGWDPSPSAVEGYEFCYGTASGDYDYCVDVGNYTSCSISGLQEETTYYFAARAYNSVGVKSDFSEELSYTMPSSGTGGSGGSNNVEIIIEAEDMSFKTGGTRNGVDWLLFSNGRIKSQTDFSETGVYVFEIAARGDLAHGVGPEMELLIDGVSKGTVLVNAESHEIFVFEVQVTAGVHEVAIGFNNDFWDPDNGIDRNLYVDNIVIYLSPDGDTPQNSGQSTVITIEAENGTLNYPFEYAWDSEASSDGFIWAPNGSGSSWDPGRESGYAEYGFEVPSAGDYVIWGRVKAMNGEDDSFFISVDSGDYALWDTQQSQSWLWDRVNDRGGNDPAVYHLKAGEHMLRIKQREDGTKIDKISITNDPAYVPEGLGNTPDASAKAPDPPSENIDPADLKLWLEAENGTLTSPFVSASDSKASAGRYAWVPNGMGNNSEAEGDAATIVFTFNVPSAGDYAFWGRVLAKNGGDNSFFVAVDDGAFAAWHVKKSTSWIWDSLKHGSSSDMVMYLEAGAHTLTIKLRENGTKIDQILITGDLTYTPE